MSAASNFSSASYSQSVCQTTAFIGSAAAHGSSRESDVAGFSEELVPLMQGFPVIPVYLVPEQSTNAVGDLGAGCMTSSGQGASADSMVQLLQGLESELAKLCGELGSGSSGQSTAASAGQSAPGGLQGDYATLYNEAASAVQDGSAFDVTLPSGETLSGKFSWSEVEVAGDNSLFTPGDPSAPDAGKQAFDNALDQFLELAQSDSGSTSAAGQIANYNTDTSFTSENSSVTWSGSFSLAPADAIPKKS